MARTIMLIHGMFLNARSWQHWQAFFRRQGFDCIAPEWPGHEGDPAILRAQVPAGLGNLSLDAVIDSARRAAASHEDLILIGHSVGGLIVQKLISEGIGTLGVPICSVAPNRMLSLDWGFFRNSMSITNPLKGNDACLMTAEGFHKNFGNTMSRADSDLAYEQFAVHESRNVLRDCLGDTGKIDLARSHAPLLFVAAQNDEIIPPSLCEKNAKAYSDQGSRVDCKTFSNRGHYICGQPRWEEVASYVYGWIRAQGITSANIARKTG